MSFHNFVNNNNTVNKDNTNTTNNNDAVNSDNSSTAYSVFTSSSHPLGIPFVVPRACSGERHHRRVEGGSWW